MKLIIFEDAKFDNLYPLTYMRPVFELRCGATSLVEKIIAGAGADSAACFVRECLAAAYAEKTDMPVNDLGQLEGDVLLVNGRLLMDGKCDLSKVAPGQMVTQCDGTLVAANVSADTLAAAKADSFEATLAALAEVLAAPCCCAGGCELTMIDFPWLLVRYNADMLEKDFQRLYADKAGVHGEMHEMACILGDLKNVYIAEGAKIHPLVVLDATDGPIMIETGTKVFPHTRVEGPHYSGPDCQLVGGKIREACSFGPMCRMGGEVECAIVHGYSNKYHDGFLGHAYVCEWVNLGAMTTNSDLKNDYSTVSVYFKGELTDTGEQFLGSMIGDHTKTSIGTIMNTGSMVGMMSNLVFSGPLMPKEVPSFSWMLNGRPTKGGGFKGMLATAKAAMGRRKKEMTEAEEALILYNRDLLKADLRAAIKKAFKR
jgi:UDP-N-acetylglucosamine diphosphorylase/glucosamine-1-phosphate N-acetyltransferase